MERTGLEVRTLYPSSVWRTQNTRYQAFLPAGACSSQVAVLPSIPIAAIRVSPSPSGHETDSLLERTTLYVSAPSTVHSVKSMEIAPSLTARVRPRPSGFGSGFGSGLGSGFGSGLGSAGVWIERTAEAQTTCRASPSPARPKTAYHSFLPCGAAASV